MFFRVRKARPNPLLFAGEVFAILMTIAYAVYISNTIYGYLPASHFLHSFLNNLMFYWPLTIVCIISLAMVWRRGLILRISFIVVWSVILLYSFFPTFFAQLF